MSASNDRPPSAHQFVPADVAQFARYVARLWDDHLGERLAGIYLIGSLAHGGYSARYSDIDMVLIAEDPLAGRELDLIRGKAALHSPALVAKHSLFWADASFSAGRLPPLDRIDYLDYGVPVLEQRRALPARPELAEVRRYLGGEPLRTWSEHAIRLSSLEVLGADDHKRYLRTLLYPARFLYSWDTGNVASNDEAVAYVERNNLLGSGIEIVADALRCRNDGSDVAMLFSERLQLGRLLSICNERVGETH